VGNIYPGRIICKIALWVALTGYVLVPNAYAFDRNDAIGYFDRLVPSWSEVTTNVWINNNDPEPGVFVGDSIIYTMTSNEPAHYTLVSIDSKGSTSVIKPALLEQHYQPTTKYVFPPLPDGCEFPIDEECTRDTNSVVQGEPVGKETVFVIATDQELPNQVLGIPEKMDFRSVGSNGSKIEVLSRSISEFVIRSGIRFAVGQYQYTVDADLQITTASINEMLNTRSMAAGANSSRSLPANSNSVAARANEEDGDVISQDIIERNTEIFQRNSDKTAGLESNPLPEIVAQADLDLKPAAVPEPEPEAEPVIELAENTSTELTELRTNPIPSGRIIASSRPALKIVGKPIVANDITFEFGSSVLDQRGKRQLDIIGSELLDRIKDRDFPIVALVGHTDSDGSESKNMKLSRDRALAAKYYLVRDWGLPVKRILTSGKGEFRPIVKNDSPKNRAKNRRVEIVLLR